MGYFENGFNDGKKGRKASPPSYSITKEIFGQKSSDQKESRNEYQRGYAAGSQQRLADEIKNQEKNKKKK